MKRYIKCAEQDIKSSTYTVVSVSPDGEEYEIATADNLDDALEMAQDAADEIFEDSIPDNDKLAELQMINVRDDSEGYMVSDETLEKYIWSLIDQLDIG